MMAPGSWRCLTGAEWRRVSISPYRHYEVSSDGRVRRDGRELTGYVDRYGYRTVVLSYAGLGKRFKVHRLVCEAFNGPCPEGHECAHLDSDPLNNSSSNLAWVTPRENNGHKAKAGRPNGSKPTSLSQENLCAIKASPLSSREAAREFGLSQSYIVRLRNGARRPVGK